ncbi:type II secretion system F family protein [Propionicimonas sp.]|uniref:type II secretion system F family protein n=1 Tax=Propionicimonas sp. TaxID=1955623 RepID=UPI0025E31A6F|nr:type II secretion system F family protein [Propionicimonas sp.]MCG2805782.1 type II secretion system F family protein [Propionicimonas sp.]
MNWPLIAAAAAMLILIGVVLVAATLTNHLPERPTTRRALPRIRQLSRLDRRTRLLLAVTIAAGLVLAITTGWWILIILLPAAAIGLPYLFDTRTETRQQARIEAMGKWVSALSGSMGAGASLEQALWSSLRSTAPEIRPEVQRLNARISSRIPTTVALRAFADEMNDPITDKIVCTLMLGADRRGAALSGVLSDLATSLDEDMAARRSVVASRATARTTARGVTGLTAVVIAALFFVGDYVDPYRSPSGQVILGVMLVLYAASLIWMKRLAEVKRPPRFLTVVGGEK